MFLQVNRFVFFALLSLSGLIFVLFLTPSINARAEKNLVIVIDPGHGGKNLGAQYDGYTEKDMTLVVAKAMQEELLKYEQVEVYLTHESDGDMSIKDRAGFAAEKNADFLFCLHFNTSVERNYFGAEVWVPAKGEYYAKGYSFAQIEMQELTELGLYSRGIKTRLNDVGNDYYGILRYCTEKNVPSALIEHCHLDHEKDKGFYQQGEEQLEALGRLDAVAAAKYFGLRSDTLGVDYSDYPVSQTDIPENTVAPDRTEPDHCQIEITEIREDIGELTVAMEAEDTDSYILYYSYSIDGGENWSSLEEWPRPDTWNCSSEKCEFTVSVPFDQELWLQARAYNGFDLFTESSQIPLEPVSDPQRLQEEAALAKEKALREAQKSYQEIHYDEWESSPESSSISFGLFGDRTALQLVLVIVLLLLLMILLAFMMAKMIILLAKGNRGR